MAEQVTKVKRGTKNSEKRTNQLVPDGHTKRSIIYPDELWDDIHKVCEAHPMSPSPTKYIVAKMREAVDADKKTYGLTD